jgi:hypothetical protein
MSDMVASKMPVAFKVESKLMNYKATTINLNVTMPTFYVTDVS